MSKGMTSGLKVLFTVVAIMVVVIILLAIFSGGAQSIGQKLSEWISGVPGEPKMCSSYTAEGDCKLFGGCHWCSTGSKAGSCISMTEKC